MEKWDKEEENHPKFIHEMTSEEIAEHNKEFYKSVGINIIFDDSIPVGEIHIKKSDYDKNHLKNELKEKLK